MPASPLRRRARLAGGRERRFYVKASASEAARLEELAGRRGVSVPRLLVESTLAQTAAAAGPAAVPSAHPAVVTELLAVSRLLGRLGVNVNQLTRVANATATVQPGAAAALEAVARVTARLEVLLGDLAPARRRGAGGGSG